MNALVCDGCGDMPTTDSAGFRVLHQTGDDLLCASCNTLRRSQPAPKPAASSPWPTPKLAAYLERVAEQSQAADEDCAKLYRVMCFYSLPMRQLARKAGLSRPRAQAMLQRMEKQGLRLYRARRRHGNRVITHYSCEQFDISQTGQ